MKSKISMHVLPVLTLFLLSPLLAEIVVGSIPATRFMDFIPAIGLYGAGVVVIRETALRLNLGWLSIFGLGIAFGVMEEAVALQSIFNPDFLVSTFLLDDGWVSIGFGPYSSSPIMPCSALLSLFA